MRTIFLLMIYLGFCSVIFASNGQKQFLASYFSEFNLEANTLSLKFHSAGTRYVKIVDGFEKGISEYNEPLSIPAGHSLQLKSHGTSLMISVIEYKKLDTQIKDKLQNITPFINTVCLIDESIDKRSIGAQKSSTRKIALSSAGMDEQTIRSFVSLIGKEKAFSVEIYDNLIVLETIGQSIAF